MITKEQAIAKAVVFNADDVVRAWNVSPLNHLQLWALDSKYRAVPEEVWETMLETHFSENDYEGTWYDCDDFSLVFSADVVSTWEINSAARVIDFSAKHSYNAVLVANDDGTCAWKIVEPQTDMFLHSMKERHVTTSDTDAMYAATSGFATVG